ncbi:MAG: PIN domain-containing protein [Bifidobacteriaceae bacterium]|nr:PIN domain-containing protein [Bifidobacteriaceae bacterium]
MEKHTPRGELARLALGALGTVARQVWLSPLVKMECLVVPYRNCDLRLIEGYEKWFSRAQVVPLEERVFLDAARLRAAHPRLGSADSLHWAAAVAGGCDTLWTGDIGFADMTNGFAPDVFATLEGVDVNDAAAAAIALDLPLADAPDEHRPSGKAESNTAS